LTGPGDSKDLQKGGAQNALVVGPSMPSTAA
jgi:pleiotropic regulator 1